MGILHRRFCRVGADAIRPGTTVRYRWRDGDGLATVTERTVDRIAFEGPACDGRFTHDQINRLVEDGRLRIVLDDVRHDREAESAGTTE